MSLFGGRQTWWNASSNRVPVNSAASVGMGWAMMGAFTDTFTLAGLWLFVDDSVILLLFPGSLRWIVKVCECVCNGAAVLQGCPQMHKRYPVSCTGIFRP